MTLILTRYLFLKFIKVESVEVISIAKSYIDRGLGVGKYH